MPKLKDELNEKELFWIIKFNATDINIGYNLLKGAKHGGTPCGGIPWNKGKKTPEDVIKKLSIAHIGNKPSKETRIKMSLIRKSQGFKHSEETKLKIGAANKGNTNMRGKHLSEETKAKMRIAASARELKKKITKL